MKKYNIIVIAGAFTLLVPLSTYEIVCDPEIVSTVILQHEAIEIPRLEVDSFSRGGFCYDHIEARGLSVSGVSSTLTSTW